MFQDYLVLIAQLEHQQRLVSVFCISELNFVNVIRIAHSIHNCSFKQCALLFLALTDLQRDDH